MTTITFFKSDDTLYGFISEGHTGYGESGEDILCAAVSSLSMFVINAIETGFGVPLTYQVDEKNATLTVSVPSILKESVSEQDKYAVSRLIYAYRRQLEELAGDYPDHIRVIERERKPGK